MACWEGLVPSHRLFLIPITFKIFSDLYHERPMCGAQGMAQLVLAMQDPSLDPQHPYKKSGMVAYACNPSASKIPGAQ